MPAQTAQHTPGPWSFACDSYGKVQHSRKACVYTTVRENGSERLVNVAQKIARWEDARLIAAAPEMLEALKALMDNTHTCGVDCEMSKPCPLGEQARAAIAKAEGGTP